MREKVSEKYSNVFDEKKIERIVGLKFQDWGNLSKAFLNFEGSNRATGEVKGILQRLWEGDEPYSDKNYNLMELLSSNFTYVEKLNERIKKIESDISKLKFEDIDDPYLSAPVKRMIWQTILIIKELYQVLGKEPARFSSKWLEKMANRKER